MSNEIEKDVSYWLNRIKDCKYEPDKIHIYCEHAQQSYNNIFKRLKDEKEKMLDELEKEIHKDYLKDYPDNPREYVPLNEYNSRINKLLTAIKNKYKQRIKK